MRALLTVAIVLAAMPAWAYEGHYEGQATFVIGNRFCPSLGPALKFDVSQDGKVVGGVRTQTKAVPFDGTVGADGKLSASYKTTTDADVVNIQAQLTDTHLEGFTQSANCRYKLSFNRR
ncbi:MAG TPA: hypothetical protein VMB81_23340 [Candidatus Sulfotelmatobacter sp.]|nr:hypothetical protein [Candidatus Sulfotelmatobacter sp.]